MFTIKIADLTVAIDNKYDYIFRQCKEYICEDKNHDFSVSVNDDEIAEEQKIGGFDFDAGYLESICMYRHIAMELPKYDAFVMHGAAIEFDHKAFCFAAKSGTGKTTHIMLWKRMFGDKVSIINGDKPIIRRINGEFQVFGTPWCGKENYGDNISAPLKGICFLEQSPENTIFEYTHHQALNSILPQVFLSADTDIINSTIGLIDGIISRLPIWHLKCNVSDAAAILSQKTMCEKA